MLIQCYDYIQKGMYIREVNAPMFTDNLTEFIQSECSKHPMYKKNTIKVRFIADKKDVCYIESLCVYLLKDYIKRDLEFRSPKMLGRMYKYFKGVFTDMTEEDFRDCVHEIYCRFNPTVSAKHYAKTDDDEYRKEYKNVSLSQYVAETQFDSKKYGISVPNIIDSVTFVNKQYKIDLIKLERAIKKNPRYKKSKYEIFENNINMIVNGVKINVYKSKELSIVFSDVSEEKYLSTLDIVMAELLQYDCLKYRKNAFKDKTDVKDCQEKRQGSLYYFKEDNGLRIDYVRVFKCDRETYSFPGYTKKGVPCCFSTSKGLSLKGLDPNYTFHPFEKPGYLNKEKMSKSLKKNVYIIDYRDRKFIGSHIPYDIYQTNNVLLLEPIFNTMYILKDPRGKTDIPDRIIKELGYSLEFPVFENIKYVKQHNKAHFTNEVTDIFGNTVYLKHKSGALMPVVPQEYTGIYPEIKLQTVDPEVQKKYLDSISIKYTEDPRGALYIESLGIYVPIRENFTNLLLDVNSELYNKLIKI